MTFHLVLCNCPPDVAPALARSLVESRIAACVNVSSAVKSTYRWKGELVCDDAEVTLSIKTTGERLDALRMHLSAHHPYELPEVLVLAVDAENSSAAYLAWVRAETTAVESG